MFSIGFWEMAFCAVIGLIVLGPEKLPSAIRSVVKGVNSIKQSASQITTQLSDELDISTATKELNKAKQEMSKNLLD